MNEVWQWFVDNWPIIRTVVGTVGGLALWFFGVQKGRLKEVALLVWGAVWELAKEGQAYVTPQLLDEVADEVWQQLKASNLKFIDLFITQAMVRAAVHWLWDQFQDAVYQPNSTNNQFTAMVRAGKGAQIKLFRAGAIAGASRLFDAKVLEQKGR